MLRLLAQTRALAAAGLVAFCVPLVSGAVHPPGNPVPADGETAVDAQAVLCATVHDDRDTGLEVRFFGRDLSTEPAADFTIVALPDTQKYAQSYPVIFYDQMEWIVEQQTERNIVFVTQVGDVVEAGRVEHEWEVTSRAFAILEDPLTTRRPDGIPYGIALGPHEQSNRGAGSVNDEGWTSELYNRYFGTERFEGRSYYGGHYGINNDNDYQLFEAGGMKFIIFHLEYDDRPTSELRERVLSWVDGVLEAHADRRAIVTSHFLLVGHSGEFSDQGRETYNALKHHRNLFLMLCGHHGHNPWRADMFEGNTVYSALSNYQFDEFGGNGWLRLYTFSPAADEIRAETYSPWLDDYKVSPQDRFVVPYDMDQGRPFAELGTVEGVASGMSPCLVWSGREPDTGYEWYVEVSDGDQTVTGPRWSFTSDGACAFDRDCDDGNPCTASPCSELTCDREPIAGCCAVDGDCDDGNLCTDDACSDGQCAHSANSNACDDGRACTEEDRCLAEVCTGIPIDCDDANACNGDACDDGECLHEFAPVDGCCTEDADCDSGDPCQSGQCLQGACAQVDLPECCTADTQCYDGNPCTTASCVPPNLAALKLDGFTYVTGHPQGSWIHEEPFLNSDRFTLELWFRWHGGGTAVMTGTVEDGVFAYPLISKGRQRDAPWLDLPERYMNYFLGIDEQTGVLVADFEEHEFGSNPGRNHPVRGTTPLTVFRWYHAAVTYDGACWQLYLNGRPETDGDDCPDEPATWNSVAFAAVGSTVTWDGAMAGLFVGMVDEVRIWRRAIGPDEIAANYTHQIAAAPGLMARWGFDGNPGLLVPDTSGLEHHAIIVGIPDWERETLVALDGAECRTSINGPDLVRRLVMTRTPTTYLDWSVLAGSPRYDLASGTLSALRSDRVATGARCIRQALTLPGVFDTRPDPESGDGYYYLVQSRNDCGPSGFGFDTDGFPRAVPDCPPDGENETSAVTKSQVPGTSPAF